ncbi:MAG: hypothetical protein U1E86_00695 [Burkholderiaceae bacterium]
MTIHLSRTAPDAARRTLPDAAARHGARALPAWPAALATAAARRLRAEAGYPDGFEVTRNCPNDRYVNDSEVCVASTAFLGRAGGQGSWNMRAAVNIAQHADDDMFFRWDTVR